MPHSRFDWANRIKAAEREYQAVRVAVDVLLRATAGEIHSIILPMPTPPATNPDEGPDGG